MKTKNRITYYRITAVSPVLTSSGNRLIEGFDFARINGETILIDVDRFFDAIESRVSQFISNQNIQSNARQMGIDLKKSCARLIYDAIPSAPFIQEFKRDAYDQPLLAGSSLKGAIRTVAFHEAVANAKKSEVESVLNDTLREAGNHRNPDKKWASSSISKSLLGENPNRDVFRVIQVGDAVMKEGSLDLYDVTMYTLSRDGSARPDGRKLSVEMLKVGATGYARVALDCDESLWDDKNGLRFSRHREIFDDFPQIAREFARIWTEKELEYISNKGLKAIEEFYSNQILPLCKEGNGAFPLHIGWGSGWRGMTGDWLAELDVNLQKRIHNTYRLSFPSPKTRKFVSVKGALMPSGWLLLEPVPKEEYLARNIKKSVAREDKKENGLIGKPASLAELKSLEERFK